MDRSDAVFYLEELYDYLNQNFELLGIPEEWLLALEEVHKEIE